MCGYYMDRGAWQATVHGAAKSQTGLSAKHGTQRWGGEGFGGGKAGLRQSKVQTCIRKVDKY